MTTLTIPRFIYGDEVPIDHPVEMVRYPWCIERIGRLWKSENDDWLTWWYNHGATVSSLSRRSGFSNDVINKRLEHLGVERENKVKQWRVSYNKLVETMSLKEISEYTGVSLRTVYNNVSKRVRGKLTLSNDELLKMRETMTVAEISKCTGVGERWLYERLDRAKN